jgi:glutathione synthase/RimK-type ligase-like ATP-grasp enzyme
MNDRVALIRDNSSRFDPDDWCNVYRAALDGCGVPSVIIDLDCDDWFDVISAPAPSALLWRVWHRPDDRLDALTKISVIEEDLGIPCFPSSRALWSYDDKIRQLYIARRLKFPMPRTIATRIPSEAITFATTCGFPIVAKAASGACGDNVWLLQDTAELDIHLTQVFSESGLPLADPIQRQRKIVYLQEYIACDRDLRIVVVDCESVLAFWRVGAGWRHNVSRGAAIVTADVPVAARAFAVLATQRLDFPWCAFDLVVAKDRLLLLEFSVQFGFSAPKKYAEKFGSWNGGILHRQALQVARWLGKRRE